MNDRQKRTFEAVHAVKAAGTAVPMRLAIIGTSGAGKTYSALRLLRGMQRIQPGPIYIIDTEYPGSMLYAPAEGKPADPAHGTFEFEKIALAPPHSPLDYRDCLESALNMGAKHIIIDSMSHEHEGEGGVLEWAHNVAVRMSEASKRKYGDRGSEPEAYTQVSYAEPKQARTKLMSLVRNAKANIVFCFRAKDVTTVAGAGKKAEHIGWQPVGGKDLFYEIPVRLLLLPGADGVPTLIPQTKEEKEAVRMPEFFRELFARPEQLSEVLGEKMARWASGGDSDTSATLAPGPSPAGLVIRIDKAVTDEECKVLADEYRSADKRRWSSGEKGSVQDAFARAKQRLSEEQHDPHPEADAEPTHSDPDGYRPDFE